MSKTEVLIEPRISAVSANRTGAILVAVEAYAEEGWNVVGPLTDAVELAAWLHERGVPGAHIQVLATATPERLDQASQTLAALGIGTPLEASQNGIRKVFSLGIKRADYELLLVYWSGHGTLTLDQRHHLLTGDASGEDILTHEVGKLESFLKTDQVGASPEALVHQVFFFDVCSDYAELNESSEKFGSRLISASFAAGGKPVPARGQFVIRATGPGFRAENRDERGVFSRELLRFLKASPREKGWPEPMACVQGVQQSLCDWRQKGEGFHLPRFNGQDWSGSDLPAFGGEGFAPIRTDQLVALRQLLADWPVPSDAFLEAACKAVSAGVVAPEGARSGRARLDWCLEELGRVTLVPMFFKFLSLCEPFAPDKAARVEVQEWAQATAQGIGIGKEQLRALWREASTLAVLLPQEESLGNVLQVVLRPTASLKGRQCYQMLFGVYYRDQRKSEMRQADAGDLSLEEVQAAFGAWVAKAAGSALGDPGNRLDFVLPFGLFNAPIEQWQIPWGVSGSRTLGTQLPVARRFFERTYPQEARRANPGWNLEPVIALQRRKWTVFTRGFVPATNLRWVLDVSSFLTAAAEAPANLKTAVLAAATLESKEHAPSQVFGCLLDSSVPVALWLHVLQDDLDEVWSFVEAIFKQPVSEWAAETRRFREKPPLLCKNIALLWDNPLEPAPPLPTFETDPLGEQI